MAAETMNSWAMIQQGVSDTERLIGQKQYNLAMVKARQTLEYMVRNLTKRNGIPDGDLMDQIDELYRMKVISKTTCEHYHKIRMLGNKAVHNDDNNAYNANNAYHLLSQEVYTFASDYAPGKRRVQSGGQNHGNRAKNEFRFSPYDLLKILIPVLAIVLVVAVFRMVKPGSKTSKAKQTTSAAATTATVVTTAAPTTAAPTTAAAVYKTTSSLNVRSSPSKDGNKLATLAAGTVVDYIGPYNNEWATIRYNGGQAYVASEFITAEQPSASGESKTESKADGKTDSKAASTAAAAKSTSKAATNKTETTKAN